MLLNSDLSGNNVQLLADLLSDLMELTSTANADFLIFRQIMLYTFTQKVFR